MVASDPSCNTDQGVDQPCECLGAKPVRVMKVNGGENSSLGESASSTDPDVFAPLKATDQPPTDALARVLWLVC
jgi:hypothetical protein